MHGWFTGMGNYDQQLISDPEYAICLAPMMGYTDRHNRYLLRLISPHLRLYTEMITVPALQYANVDRFLNYSPIEHPVAIQLGGSNSVQMALVAEKVAKYGYDEININVGCPSDKVHNGGIGASLFMKPDVVAQCVRAIREACDLKISIKTRIGVNDCDDLDRFVDINAEAGCRIFIIHARKAWLNGLNPKQNRNIPPLNYERVYRLKKDFPELKIILNGGITDLSTLQSALNHVEGSMIGRKILEDPLWLIEIERALFNPLWAPDVLGIVERYLDYCDIQRQKGQSYRYMLRYLGMLSHGMPRSRQFRRQLSEMMLIPEVSGENILKLWRDIIGFSISNKDKLSFV